MELALTIAAQMGLLFLTAIGPVTFYLNRMRDDRVPALAPARAYPRPSVR